MLFEIHLARTVDPSRLLSEDITRDGKVKLMTRDEARAAGFASLPEPPAEMTVCYVAASGRDAKFVHHVLENNPDVMAMRTHDSE
jgi:hypothetical protein